MLQLAVVMLTLRENLRNSDGGALLVTVTCWESRGEGGIYSQRTRLSSPRGSRGNSGKTLTSLRLHFLIKEMGS